jgi:hypothetical protein
MLASCADLRFFDPSGSAVPYWIETGCNTSKTLVWVRPQLIPAGTSQLHVRMNNPSATPASAFTTPPTGLGVGTGADGAVVVNGTVDLNVATLSTGRSCQDGGDAVSYRMTTNLAAGAVSVPLSAPPSAGCLSPGDEVLVVALQGPAGRGGAYEFARVTAATSATLFLNHPLASAFQGASDKVVVQRVPNYASMTVSTGAILSASVWNGATGGLLAFRAENTLLVAGAIDVSGLGYRGGVSRGVGPEDATGRTSLGGGGGAGGTGGHQACGDCSLGGSCSAQPGGGADGSSPGNVGRQTGGCGTNEGGNAIGGGGGGGVGGGFEAGSTSVAASPGGAGGARALDNGLPAQEGLSPGGGGGGGGGPRDSAGGGGGGCPFGASSNRSSPSLTQLSLGGGGASGAGGGGGGGGGDVASANGGSGGSKAGAGGARGSDSGTNDSKAGADGLGGGNGGGAVIISAGSISITGSILASGAAGGKGGAGGAGSSNGFGGGGGGGGGGGSGASGGSIRISAISIAVGANLVTAIGGAGGARGLSGAPGSTRGGSGGDGGAGRQGVNGVIAIDYSTLAGTTSPAATATPIPVQAP